MKRIVVVIMASMSALALAQKPSVYPAHGQSQQQQTSDDGACYSWAKQSTGIDPAVVAQTPAPQSGPTGARVRGAARGAAAGAIVGDVSNNDAGHGAAVGATAGAVAGGVRNRQQQAAQLQTAQANQQSAMSTYWRAYDSCMQGKGYTVQ